MAAIVPRHCRRNAKLVAIHAAFTKELSGSHYPDDRLLALLGHDSHLDVAFLNVKHSVSNIALLEHVLILVEFQYLFSRTHFGEKVFRVKHVLVWLLQGSLLWLGQFHPTFSAPNC